MDLGFGALVARNRDSMPSVIVLRPEDETPGNVNGHFSVRFSVTL